MSDSASPDDSHPILRAFGAIILVGVFIASVWLLFRFIVTDEELFLSYVKVLTWPTVVVIAGYWFREPVKEKLGQLLRLEGLGARADFGGERLGQALQPSVDALLDEGEPLTDEEVQADEGPEPDDGTEVNELKNSQTKDRADIPIEPPDEPPNSVPAAFVREELLRIARALDLPVSTRHDLWDERLPTVDAARQATRHLAHAAASLRQRRATRHESTRENLESVIQTSAKWGYEMGRAGAPQAVPDIEWKDDGTWVITTEVPDHKASPSPSATARRDRQIRQMEEEIRDLERKRNRTGPGATLAFLSDEDAYRRSLKRRLASVDPGNFWAGPIE